MRLFTEKKLKTLFSLIFIGLLCLPSSLYSQSLNLDQVRSGFLKAVKEENSCTDLYIKMCNGSNCSDAVWMAYHGTITMTMARYTFNPLMKYRYFEDGKGLIEKSVLLDPKNIEVRFLRFTVQDHSPAFLGYNKELSEDKKYILEHLESIPYPFLKKAIINYIVASDRFTSDEKKWATNLITS